MAYKRSITSSHESDNTPSPQYTDSSVSYPSGCSPRSEWVWNSEGRAHRLPRTPSSSDSSHMDSKEESLFDQDCLFMHHNCERGQSSRVATKGQTSRAATTIPWNKHLFATPRPQSSRKATPRPQSSPIDLQRAEAESHRRRVEELQQGLQASQHNEQSVMELNALLADRVAELSVFSVGQSLGLSRARAMVKKLCVGLVVAVVVLLLVWFK